MNKPTYAIAVPAFSGPLDLLLHLIERNEFDITAVSLAAVTDQYLQQVALLQEGRVAQMIDFIVIGARLMLIKSRALLPAPPVVPLDEEEEEDPAEALVRQLRQYKQFKDAAALLGERLDAGLHTYVRLAPPPRIDTRLDVSGVTPATLRQLLIGAAERVLERRASVAVAAPRRITIEGQINRLRAAVRSQARLPFTTFLSERVTSTELSVTLLAVLEMVKRHEIEVEQTELFGPVAIRRAERAPDAPPDADWSDDWPVDDSVATADDPTAY